MHMQDNLDLRLFTRFRQFSDIQLQSIGGFQGQGLILTLLRKHGTLTQRQLATLTQRKSATLSEQLDNMEKSGKIFRDRNENDKRTVDISLTDLGKICAAEADEVRNAAAISLFTSLDAQEKQRLFDLLGRLIAAADREPI